MTTRVRAQMPGDQTPPPRARGWSLGTAGILVILAYSAYLMIERSGHPNGFKGRTWDVAVNGAWPYPTELVRTCLILMGLDALFGIWLLRRRSTTRLAVRSLTFAVLNFFGMVLMVPLMMHSSEPLGSMLAWLLFATAWGLVFAVGVGVASLGTGRNLR